MGRTQRNKGGVNKQPANASVKKLDPIDKCYWENPTHNIRFGLMTGLVTPEQAAWFDDHTPEGISYKDYVLDYDPIEKHKKEARKRLENREL